MNVELMNVLAALQKREVEFTLSRPASARGENKLFVKAKSGKLTDDEKAVLKSHRAVLIEMLEDDEMERTGVIQSERQVFEMAEVALAGMNKPHWGERKAS